MALQSKRERTYASPRRMRRAVAPLSGGGIR
nr:MAG TPA: hypothetical protein [Caudoviricetes sp.]